jgi:uncharacterized membrane protein (DUF373 family)
MGRIYFFPLTLLNLTFRSFLTPSLKAKIMTVTRNIYAYVLASLVLVITIFALLGIWDIIQWEQFIHLFWKAFYSLLIVFFSALIVLFIFSTIYKSPESEQQSSERKHSAQAE